MKKLNVILTFGLMLIMSSDHMLAQVSNSADRNNVSLKIPDRFKKIDQQGKRLIFKDSKTKDIFSFEKVDSYVFENLLGNQIQSDLNKCLNHPNYSDVRESKKLGMLGIGHIIDFEELDDEGQKIGINHRLVLMDVNGTIYRFTIQYKAENRQSSFQMLDKILDSSIPLYKESFFKN